MDDSRRLCRYFSVNNLRLAHCDDPACASTVGDVDRDGVSDAVDNCLAQTNPSQADLDGDMRGDPCDLDDDNDGIDDDTDAFPADPAESTDTDGDGTGNNADVDDDGDGQLDVDEVACGSDPLDPSSTSPDANGNGSPDCVEAPTVDLPETGSAIGQLIRWAILLVASGVVVSTISRQRPGRHARGRVRSTRLREPRVRWSDE